VATDGVESGAGESGGMEGLSDRVSETQRTEPLGRGSEFWLEGWLTGGGQGMGDRDKGK